jgi:hypothetical protein
MRRRLFMLAAILSAALLVAVCAMWVRSYWREETIFLRKGTPDGLAIYSARGYVMTIPGRYDRATRQFYVKRTATVHFAHVYPIAAAAAAVLPLAWVISSSRRRRRDRLARGLCPRCGYDLRATPEQCPECGAVTTKGAA